MSEIERAIECFKKKVWSGELYEAEVDMYNAVIKLLRAELSRQEDAPMTCEGCKRDDAPGFYKDCQHCKRNANDYYEPKGEKE